MLFDPYKIQYGTCSKLKAQYCRENQLTQDQNNGWHCLLRASSPACILLLLRGHDDLDCCIIPCSFILYNFITYSVLTRLLAARAIIAFPCPNEINDLCHKFKLISMKGYSQFLYF